MNPPASEPAGRAAPDAPALSVVVVSFNPGDDLPRCIRSVLLPGREVIVVDNGSTDGSRDRLGDLAGEIDWVDNHANLGFARAANRGLRRARGRHVLFLNPDAVANPGAIAAAIGALEGDPSIGLVSVAIRDESGALVPTVEPFHSLLGTLARRWSGRVSAPRGPGPVRIDWCHGAFLLGRREELREIGGFDERFFLYAEDMDLCRRMQESGRAVVYLPEVSIVHRGNAAAGALLGERRAEAIFASLLIGERARRGAAAALALRVAALPYFALRAFAATLRGADGESVRYRGLARVALLGPQAGPLADAARRAAEVDHGRPLAAAFDRVPAGGGDPPRPFGGTP